MNMGSLSTMQNMQLKKIYWLIQINSCFLSKRQKDDDNMGVDPSKAACKNHNLCKNTVIQVLIYM